MNSKFIISVPVAPVYRNPSFSSEMVTQGLMWESVNKVHNKGSWICIEMEDSYNGWIHEFYLRSFVSVEKYISLYNRIETVYKEPDNLESIITLLSFGTRIPIIKKLENIIQILLPNKKTAYITTKEQGMKNDRSTIVFLAESLLGTPYIWGGKSSFGFDCSGFVQLIMKSVGINLSRDAKEQYNTTQLNSININNSLPGDLIFFRENKHISHVGFMLSNYQFIHCSGEVKINSMNNEHNNYNEKLANLDSEILSISQIIES